MLTDAKCKNATSKGLTIRKLADGGGLYLWVYGDGRKYWRFRYWQAGKEKALSVGVYPAIGLKAARKRRDAERKHLDDKLDPSAERRAEKVRLTVAAANSFEAVAREWYAKQKVTWRPSHAADVLGRLERNIFPKLGRRAMSQIDAPELLAAVRPIEHRGAHDLAHRVLQVCGQVFRYAVATARASRDPSGDLRGALTPHVGKYQAAVRPEELPALLRAIEGYEKTGDRQTRLGLELLSLTFVRTQELIGAQWPEFDLGADLWVVPAERMKMKREHIVPLSKQAVRVIEQLRDCGGGSRFVFPGRNRDRPMSNNTMLFALYRLGYKGKMTGHGFRAVASTMLNEKGVRPDAIERQLAHTEKNEVRGAYNRAEYLPERKKMMQFWADHLDKLRTGADVIAMRGRAA